MYGLPVTYTSEKVGHQIGDFIGEFLEYDNNNNSSVWREYMRIKVSIDVCLPLVRYKNIKKKNGS